ncbi:hypothetical protein MMSP_0818 [Mycobacterium sp. 012931]|nr:hypothetical protein MMSP_0818 [Mycobacterium sp. 012931]
MRWRAGPKNRSGSPLGNELRAVFDERIGPKMWLTTRALRPSARSLT